MYRTIFTPTETDSVIPFSIPREWYGQNVEFIVFPLNMQKSVQKNERKFKEIPSKYLFDTRNFKFNRDEANDYE